MLAVSLIYYGLLLLWSNGALVATADVISSRSFSSNKLGLKRVRSINTMTTILEEEEDQQQSRELQGDATCSFQMLIAGDCTVEEHCIQSNIAQAILEDETDANAFCDGDADGEWFIAVEFGEGCYADAEDDIGFVYDEATFDPTTDYCSAEQLSYNFMAGELVSYSFTEVFTRPGVGSVQEVYAVERCPLSEDTVVAVDVGEYYCDAPGVCPESHFVNGTLCTGCTECDDGEAKFDCTNVDASLVDVCGTDIDELYPNAIEYFRNAASSGTTTPPFVSPMATPTDFSMSPALSPVAEGPEDESAAPSASPVAELEVSAAPASPGGDEESEAPAAAMSTSPEATPVVTPADPTSAPVVASSPVTSPTSAPTPVTSSATTTTTTGTTAGPWHLFRTAAFAVLVASVSVWYIG